MDNRYLKNIKVGMEVEIMMSNKRTSKGIVREVAKTNEFSEQGIMVVLKNGDVGRVKKIIPDDGMKKDALTEELDKIIEKGENLHNEFKTSAFWSITMNPEQIKQSKSFEVRDYGTRASKFVIAKSIASFLNSDGGNLLIGINEDKVNGKAQTIGIEDDMKRVNRPDKDGYKRILIDEIIRAFLPPKIFNHLDSYIEIIMVVFQGKLICWLKVKKSDAKVFLRINNKELFFIRIDSENRILEGERLVDYCIRKWGNRL